MMVKYFLLFGTLAHAVENKKYVSRGVLHKTLVLKRYCFRNFVHGERAAGRFMWSEFRIWSD